MSWSQKLCVFSTSKPTHLNLFTFLLGSHSCIPAKVIGTETSHLLLQILPQNFTRTRNPKILPQIPKENKIKQKTMKYIVLTIFEKHFHLEHEGLHELFSGSSSYSPLKLCSATFQLFYFFGSKLSNY